MFLIREAGPKDFSGVYPLAKLLDSYNLPADPAYVKHLLRLSRDSFRGKVPREKAKYLFVLEAKGRLAAFAKGSETTRPSCLVGCSLIIAKHGTKGSPHLWFGLERLVKKSRTLRLTRSHEVLRLGYTEDGPTQVGGLEVLPGFRRHPAHCGLQLSYARFLYMAIHPRRFEEKVLVEYRGLSRIGEKSPFWEAVGKTFTGLSYKKADRLSVANKEFILGLLPKEPIYRALLPRDVRRAIGAVHPGARRAVVLLRRIGFRPIPQVEPFDAGRYYAASRKKIRLVKRTRRMVADRGEGGRTLCLAGTDRGGFFRALLTRVTLQGNRCKLEEEALKSLGIKPGDTVHACPL